MKQVSILALSKALSTSIGIPLEMLNAANDIARSEKLFDKILAINIRSQDKLSVVLAGGLDVKASKRIDSKEDEIINDLIFVPTFWGNPLVTVRKHDKSIAWLKNQHKNGATICSVGTGSYLLAEAGLLDNKIATTHWYYFDDFQERYPAVKLQRKRFITRAENLYCTGSINAARDLMIFLIEQLYSESIANQVSRHFTHELKRSYESLLLSKDQHNTHHDENIIKMQEWFQHNLQSQILLSSVAAKFKMSIRSLNRRFKTATGKSPLQYLQELRIEQAKELLKQSNLDISEIAYRVGYSDASYFSGLFRKINAVSPNEYRSLVRNKLFVTEARTDSGASEDSKL